MNIALLAATALPFVITPGASFTITVSAAITGDRRAPVKVWSGTSLGILLLAGVAGFSGLGQLVAGSDVARIIFGVVGGVVLIAIGIVSLTKTMGRPKDGSDQPPRPAPRLVLWAFLAVITNVKALSLYGLLVPSLSGIGVDGPALFLAFAAVHVVMLFAWLTLLGVVVRSVPWLGTSRRARDLLLLLAAVTLVALGAWSLVDAMAETAARA
ncbi:LysE family translocator [Agromyces laixinhei]|uniref:LysE family translocator n=1 Tax=Agromyces laixinhei TaxID=2585717 RepID=UPI0011162658|nr:LysE family transporter [Agromyces laixinhei]